MGLSRQCCIESKLFELVVEGGFSILRIIERSKGIVRSINLGKANISWLLASIDDLVLEEWAKVF
jgi:hypothetical protein